MLRIEAKNPGTLTLMRPEDVESVMDLPQGVQIITKLQVIYLTRPDQVTRAAITQWLDNGEDAIIAVQEWGAQMRPNVVVMAQAAPQSSILAPPGIR